jgi:purine-nucleoside phosphorylase/ribosomal protein S18 acetylase RimI-like enzyme
MLKELTKADWLRILDLPASRIPDVVILRGTRNFRSQYKAMLPHFENVLEVGTPNGILEDVLIGEVRDRSVGFACVYGSPMASEVVHLFGVLGTRAVVQIGNCGALADDFLAGDLFLAERAFCGEGAAQYYKPNGKWVTASERLLTSKTLSALNREDHRIGSIYSTAALFAEGEKDIEQWFQDGFAAVDLETAATYAVAEHFGMERLSILYAFDNPRRREHLLLSDAAKDVRRAEGNARMIRLALDLAVEISEGDRTKTQRESRELVIRACRPDEAEAVLALWREAEAAKSSTDTVENLRRAILQSPAIVLVAEREGRLIGSIIGSWDGWRGNIYRLAVTPPYRRQGVARALVREVEQQLARQGVRRITALVLKDHSWATAFWPAAGYEPDHRIARYVRNLEGERMP